MLHRRHKLFQPTQDLTHPMQRFSLLFILLTGFVTITTSSFGQDEPARKRGSRIIDDSTKQVYGPTTSKYYYESDVFLNKLQYHTIDTAIRNFHRFTYVQRNHYMYQDLGNVGTAMRPIFYQVPTVIGATSGFAAYDLIWDSEPIKYYDTKSPYTNMYVMLGGKGRSMTRATFSRNITPQWNFGFTYRALLVDKQVQRQAKGDRNIRSTYYDMYTAFQSKDSSYRAFANFRRNNIEADEYGGIKKTTDFVYADYFFNNAQPNLLDAGDKDLRMNFHLFHQYEIGRALQLYHTFDRYRQGTRFTDKPGNAPEGFYDHSEYDSAATEDRTKFKYVRHELGIKGNLLKLYYNGYYANRRYTLSNSHTDTLRSQLTKTESYLGGRMSLRLDSLVEVTGWAELQQKGNYRLDGQIKSQWFEASLKQVQYDVPLVYQTYRGQHDAWSNDFSPVNVTQLNGYLHYNSKVLSVSPGLTFSRLGNYVFFKYDDSDPTQEQKVLPVQTSGQQVIFSPEFKFSLTLLRHINLNSQIIYTKMLKNSGDGFQIPELFINAQLAYENIFFNDNLDMHAGFDIHYQSDYLAPAYDVPIQQFYIQQTTQVQAFPMIDIFFSARIKRGRIFFKYNNIIQAFTKEGYIVTPEYPGQRNILDFGFDWSFYD